MLKSHTKSHTIQLPNGCFCTELKVMPADWMLSKTNLNKDWYIHYTFFDPEFPKGKRIQIRGMNHVKVLAYRRLVCKKYILEEIEQLRGGKNPIRNKVISVNDAELSPDTPFIQALLYAVEKIKVVRAFYTDIKSVVRGVEKSARELGIESLAIKEVTRKYYKAIFERCYKNNPRFTAATQNRYRKSLLILYSELIEREAVDINPLRDIKKLKEIKRQRVMPTPEERNKLSLLKENFYPFWRAIQMFFHSGARETELMRVQRKHVDIAGGRCLYLIKKGVEIREVWRPIVDTALPLWREIANECKSENDYLFSRGMQPGKLAIRTEQLSRRWRRHVKDGLGINVDFYTLKHLHTTEMMDELTSGGYDPVNDVAKLNGHTSSAMVINIYDKNNKTRKDDKIRKVAVHLSTESK